MENLTPTAKLVLLKLADYAGEDGGNIFPGQEKLAPYIGISARQVRRHLKDLEEAGLISIHRRGNGRTNTYKIDREAVRTFMVDDERDRTPASDQDRTPATTLTGHQLPVQEDPPVNHKRNHQDKRPRTRKRGPRDDLWDAVADCWGVTAKGPETSRRAKTVKVLFEADVTPAEVPILKATLTLMHPQVTTISAEFVASRIGEIRAWKPVSDAERREVAMAIEREQIRTMREEALRMAGKLRPSRTEGNDDNVIELGSPEPL